MHRTEALQFLLTFPHEPSRILYSYGNKFFAIHVFFDGKKYTTQKKKKKTNAEEAPVVMMVFYTVKEGTIVVFDFYHLLLDGNMGNIEI